MGYQFPDLGTPEDKDSDANGNGIILDFKYIDGVWRDDYKDERIFIEAAPIYKQVRAMCDQALSGTHIDIKI